MDYLLSAFSLSAILIRSHNDRKEFARCSHLTVILSNPTCFDLSVYRRMAAKVRALKITTPNRHYH